MCTAVGRCRDSEAVCRRRRRMARERLAGRWEAAAQPHFTVAPAVCKLDGHGTSSQVGPFTQVPVPAGTGKATGHKQESPELRQHLRLCWLNG